MTTMARPGSSRVFIHEDQVQAYIREGGEARQAVNDVARAGRELARTYLRLGKYGSRNGNHVRSGRLYGGTNWNRAKDTGPLTAKAEVYNNAKHVWYFIEGTRGTIRPKGQWGFMLVPRKVGVPQRSPATKGAGSELYLAWRGRNKKGVRGFYRAKKVRGQRAKPFLQDAVDAALEAWEHGAG
jgi:hypothetical protein